MPVSCESGGDVVGTVEPPSNIRSRPPRTGADWFAKRTYPYDRLSFSGEPWVVKVGDVRDKQLHEFILVRIEQALNGRSWAWLARKSGVPRSTLMTQSTTPHFSLDVLASVAHSLGRPMGYFFPQGLSTDEAGRSAQDLLDHIRTIIARDEAG